MKRKRKKNWPKKKENNSKTRQYKGKKFANNSKEQREGEEAMEGKGYNRKSKIIIYKT